jgi:DNA-directed RNA polymerase specialized sigma24 family protein
VAQSCDRAREGSVSLLITGLWRGSDAALTQIVARFRLRLTSQVRRRLGPELAKAVDAEDLAMAAFFSLWRATRKPRKEPLQLADRNDLLRLLAEFTLQKVQQARRYHLQHKRDVRRTLRDADVPLEPGRGPLSFHLADRHSSGEWEVLFEDVKATWLADLRPVQQEIVCLRLEGFRNAEIAGMLGRSLRSVERELLEIRSRWRERAAGLERTR